MTDQEDEIVLLEDMGPDSDDPMAITFWDEMVAKGYWDRKTRDWTPLGRQIKVEGA